jgi:tetratricopeptide (TPR) repeat protein
MSGRLFFPCAVLAVSVLLFSVCSQDKKDASDTQDRAVAGTWAKINFDGDWFALTLGASDDTYEIDFPGDAQSNARGHYTLAEGQIFFEDEAGGEGCSQKGTYTYRVEEHLLTLSLVEDSCSGRARVVSGEWIASNYHEIIEQYDGIIASDSARGETYYSRGRLRLAMREYKNAFGDLDQAVEMGVAHAEIYAKRGLARVMASRDYQGGLSDFNKAIELAPEMGRAYFDRARIKIELDDKKGACYDWQKASELGVAQAEKMLRHHCWRLFKDKYLSGSGRK